MIKNNERKEKMCLFFASDYHFEMISLPYISKNLDKNKKIIMFTENNLQDTVEKVLSRTNIFKEQKDKIEMIDWKNNDFYKFQEIKNANEDNKDTIIFIKGKENYINNTNKNINDLLEANDFEIIDCYDINEVQEDITDIAKRYKKILSTSGIEKLLH